MRRATIALPLALLACAADPGEILGDGADASLDDRPSVADHATPRPDVVTADIPPARDASVDVPAAPIDVPPTPIDVPPTPIDVPATPIDTGALPGPSNPPLARPPSPPPDRSAVVRAVAAEHPDWLQGSCVTMGGSWRFLFEVLRRLRAEDPRWGLNATATGWVGDQIAYHWGNSASEGSTEAWAIDVIARHCGIPGMHEPPAPAWFDLTANGVRWTLRGYDPTTPPPVDAGTAPTDTGPTTGPRPPLPDGSGVVRALAAERPDLLRASCVEMGGNNEFLFEVVRRLRRMDRRWGLNWKRGRVGDLSQDVVDYYFGPGNPTEGSTDVYIVDMIGGHCGATPSAAWTDVTEATAAGGTIGRWTLGGRSDL